MMGKTLIFIGLGMILLVLASWAYLMPEKKQHLPIPMPPIITPPPSGSGEVPIGELPPFSPKTEWGEYEMPTFDEIIDDILPPTRNNILFTLDGEKGLIGLYRSGTGNGEPWMRTGCASDGFPVRAGGCSYLFNLSRFESPVKPLDANYPRYSGNSSYRTGAALRIADTLPWVGTGQAQPSYTIVMGKDYWFGMSIYLPANWINGLSGRDTLIYQTQAYPDVIDCDPALPYDCYRSPVFDISVDNDHWKVSTKYDTRPISPAGNTFTGYWSTDVGPLSKGKWTDFVWKIRYGYNNTGPGAGHLELWKNGVLAINRTMGIGSNDAVGPYPSILVYNWFWSPQSLSQYSGPFPREKTELYVDEYRIGNENATYNDVAPR